jgi:HEAT repeat protein
MIVISMNLIRPFVKRIDLMLDGLDQIDWKQLTHAYGPADDVPALIRALLSQDKRQRDHAIYELFGNIYHQGTVYEATAHAVPFLIELLDDPSTPDRSIVACLLASIADGCGYLEVHARPEWGESTWRKILAKEGKTLEDELEREHERTISVRGEAIKAVPKLLPYLSDPEPEVRSSVAAALGAFPEYRDVHLSQLAQALATETDDEVRERIEGSIARLNAT